MHSAKASRQSSGFHGKLITILRPLITSSLSIRQRNLLFVPFLLLSHPLCWNKPPKMLCPGLCLCLAPFHHNYTAEQNPAPALESVQITVSQLAASVYHISGKRRVISLHFTSQVSVGDPFSPFNLVMFLSCGRFFTLLGWVQKQKSERRELH